MNWIIDTILGHRGFCDWYTMTFYFFPIFLNAWAGVHFLRDKIKEDLAARDKYIERLKDKNSGDWDHNQYLTVGDILFYILTGACPVLSTWCALFRALPYLLDRVFNQFEWLFKIRIIKAPK